MPRQIDLLFRPDAFAAQYHPRSACRMVNTILRMRARQTMAHVCRRVLWLDGSQTNPPTPLTHQTGSGWTRWSSAAGSLRELDLGTVAPSCAPTETICCIGSSRELRASFHPDRAVRCLLKVGNVSFLRQTSAKPCQAKLAGAPIAINLRCLKFSGKYVPKLVRLTIGDGVATLLQDYHSRSFMKTCQAGHRRVPPW
jgi:hypothetical protein